MKLPPNLCFLVYKKEETKLDNAVFQTMMSSKCPLNGYAAFFLVVASFPSSTGVTHLTGVSDRCKASTSGTVLRTTPDLVGSDSDVLNIWPINLQYKSMAAHETGVAQTADLPGFQYWPPVQFAF